jgi:hypothetical protein
MNRIAATINGALIILMVCGPLRGQDARFVVFEGGKHGHIDKQGVLAIPITLEGTYVIDFSEGLARFSESVKPKPLHVPYVDAKGKVRISPEEKWGFIDTGGAVTIPPQFDSALDFSEGLAGVAFDTDQTAYNCLHCDRNQHWGFVDRQGRMIVQAQFRSVRPFSEGLAAVQRDDGKWGYINTNGDVVISFRFQLARSFHEGLAAAAVDKKAGYIDKSGSFVVQPRFTLLRDFSEGLAAVRVGGKTEHVIVGPAGGRWMFIGKDGKTRIPLPRDVQDVEDFAEGRAVTRSYGQCGYVGPKGALVVPLRFYICGNFSEGLAVVYRSGKTRYIDRNGHVMLEVPYDFVYPFKNGLAPVNEGSAGPTQKFGYIDKHGNQVWKPRRAL